MNPKKLALSDKAELRQMLLAGITLEDCSRWFNGGLIFIVLKAIIWALGWVGWVLAKTGAVICDVVAWLDHWGESHLLD